MGNFLFIDLVECILEIIVAGVIRSVVHTSVIVGH